MEYRKRRGASFAFF